MIAALQDLVLNGIDYSCTEQALGDIQVANSHLHEFARDVGLTYVDGGLISINDLWRKLEGWYQSNGTLRSETDKSGNMTRCWTVQVNSSDKNVTGANQVSKRFIKLFPRAKYVHIGNNKHALKGLGFVPDANFQVVQED